MILVDFFLGPWLDVCQFVEISYQMESNGEVTIIERIFFIYRVSKENANYHLNKNILGCMHATELCNTAMERQFYRLSEDVFRNCEKFSYEA